MGKYGFVINVVMVAISHDLVNKLLITKNIFNGKNIWVIFVKSV